jgi:hypothetical protein
MRDCASTDAHISGGIGVSKALRLRKSYEASSNLNCCGWCCIEDTARGIESPTHIVGVLGMLQSGEGLYELKNCVEMANVAGLNTPSAGAQEDMRGASAKEKASKTPMLLSCCSCGERGAESKENVLKSNEGCTSGSDEVGEGMEGEEGE